MPCNFTCTSSYQNNFKSGSWNHNNLANFIKLGLQALTKISGIMFDNIADTISKRSNIIGRRLSRACMYLLRLNDYNS